MGRYGFEVKSNPETFSPSTYAGFRERNPSVSVDVVTFDSFAEKPTHSIWERSAFDAEIGALRGL